MSLEEPRYLPLRGIAFTTSGTAVRRVWRVRSGASAWIALRRSRARFHTVYQISDRRSFGADDGIGRQIAEPLLAIGDEYQDEADEVQYR